MILDFFIVQITQYLVLILVGLLKYYTKMSSHHFVKEGQEPALVVANGQSCSYELLSQIMEWCPYIVALDGAYARLCKLQVFADLVIGDMDSLGVPLVNKKTQFIQIDNQENTDLEKAIDYLIEKGYQDINVVWATGKRLDHTINNVVMLAKYPNSKIVIYDDCSRMFVAPKAFSKVYKKGDLISLVPIPSCDEITTENLKHPLNKESLQLGKRSGTSNEVSSTGIVKITYTSGLLALIESSD
jgi:thiamine pyrophosphokinase